MARAPTSRVQFLTLVWGGTGTAAGRGVSRGLPEEARL